MSEATWRESYNAAQQIPLPDLERISSDAVKRLVTAPAEALGCPPEYLFVPLLTCCAGLMTNRTKIKVNQVWSEPVCLWSVVAAQKGSRKTMALKLLTESLVKVQASREDRCQIEVVSNAKSKASAEAIVSGICPLDELKDIITSNGGHSLCLVENMELHHKMLGLTENSERVLCDLYDGMPLIGSTKGTIHTITSSVFNHSGMASPEYIVHLMNNSPQWLSGKYVISCPPMLDRSVLNNVHLSLSEDVPTFRTIYKALLHFHETPREYCFTQDAVKVLNSYIVDEWGSVVSLFDECDTRRGVVDKSVGQVVRLSGIILALINACEHSESAMKEQAQSQDFCKKDEESSYSEWNLYIDTNTVQKAIELSRYFLEQKLVVLSNSAPNASLTIMRPAYQLDECVNSATSADGARRKLSVGTNNKSSHNSSEPYGCIQNDTVNHNLSVPCSSPLNSVRGNSIQANRSVRSSESLIQQSSSQLPPRTKRPRVEDLDLGIEMYSNVSDDVQGPGFFGGEQTNGKSQVKEDWESGIPEGDHIDIHTAVDFVCMDKQTFVMTHGKRIKRLLECYDDGSGVSATVSAQKSIAPPVKIQASSNRHPVWASILFFKKVAELDIGTAEQTKHPTNRKFFWRFKRKRTENLTARNIQLLQYLFVDMTVFSNVGKAVKGGFSQELPPILDCNESNNGSSNQSMNIKFEPMD